jgi:hypothetical protein
MNLNFENKDEPRYHDNYIDDSALDEYIEGEPEYQPLTDRYGEEIADAVRVFKKVSMPIWEVNILKSIFPNYNFDTVYQAAEALKDLQTFDIALDFQYVVVTQGNITEYIPLGEYFTMGFEPKEDNEIQTIIDYLKINKATDQIYFNFTDPFSLNLLIEGK